MSKYDFYKFAPVLNCSITASPIVTKLTLSFKQNFSKKADYTDESN